MNKLFTLRTTIAILIPSIIVSLVPLIFEGLGDQYVMPKNEYKINGKICGMVSDHGAHKYTICGGSVGIYFFYDHGFKEAEEEILSFVKFNETRILKRSGSSIVYFMNGSDTLQVEYSINAENGVLYNGKVLR